MSITLPCPDWPSVWSGPGGTSWMLELLATGDAGNPTGPQPVTGTTRLASGEGAALQLGNASASANVTRSIFPTSTRAWIQRAALRLATS